MEGELQDLTITNHQAINLPHNLSHKSSASPNVLAHSLSLVVLTWRFYKKFYGGDNAA